MILVLQISGWKFDDLTVTIQQRLCEALFAADRIKEAGEAVLRIVDQEGNMTKLVETWVSGELIPYLPFQCRRDHLLSDFKYRCRSKLEDLGDSAAIAELHDEAISQYTAALFLGLPSPQDLLVKRSKSRARKGLWEGALNDANEVVHFQLLCVYVC